MAYSFSIINGISQKSLSVINFLRKYSVIQSIFGPLYLFEGVCLANRIIEGKKDEQDYAVHNHVIWHLYAEDGKTEMADYK